MDEELEALVKEVFILIKSKGARISVAESCTGGLLSSYLTRISGSSAIFHSGLVVYSDEAKTLLLGVSKDLIEKYGSVSEACSISMAKNLMNKTKTDLAVSITGFAGPTGDVQGNNIGLVYIGIITKLVDVKVYKFVFSGSRQEVILQACKESLRLVQDALILQKEFSY